MAVVVVGIGERVFGQVICDVGVTCVVSATDAGKHVNGAVGQAICDVGVTCAVSATDAGKHVNGAVGQAICDVGVTCAVRATDADERVKGAVGQAICDLVADKVGLVRGPAVDEGPVRGAGDILAVPREKMIKR